ncbi:MAG TPA: hypothetical protein PLQ52_02450 [Lacunisphaera sp.]|jgi:hypothetical protein|nr:hypothetical protein [Lacunisphaera sp.]
MKSNHLRLTCAVLLMAGGLTMGTANTVLSPAKRQAALERGKSLLAPREIVPLAVNPFYPEAFAETVAGLGRTTGATATTTGGDTATTVPTGPRGDRELVEAIAKSLKPSGYIVLGGQASISFGQKRVKAGGILTITFEGNQYTLEITSIDRTNFTLRLNREEFTRTIK